MSQGPGGPASTPLAPELVDPELPELPLVPELLLVEPELELVLVLVLVHVGVPLDPEVEEPPAEVLDDVEPPLAPLLVPLELEPPEPPSEPDPEVP
jgi:hypothetical protein